MRRSALLNSDIICFSPVRWTDRYKRLQYLLTRFARERRVFFIEEPVYDSATNYNEITQVNNQSIWIITPHLAKDDMADHTWSQQLLLNEIIQNLRIRNYICWYYSPLSLAFSHQLLPQAIVYDCTNEYCAYPDSPRHLRESELALLGKADIVFAEGYKLYEAKYPFHKNIYAFPNSVEKEHFFKARDYKEDVEEQAGIPHPRIGFYGVINERFNMNLVTDMAKERTDWHFIIIGPMHEEVASQFPSLPNIHILGSKSYDELPHYIAGWDVAIIPFVHNASTRFIHPKKMPEYLASGKPVVSTSIYDIISPYGRKGLAYIADTPGSFISAIEKALVSRVLKQRLLKVDRFLSSTSWDKTYRRMFILIEAVAERKKHTLKMLPDQQWPLHVSNRQAGKNND